MHRAYSQLSAQGIQPDLEAAGTSALLSLSAEACLGPVFRPRTQRGTLMSSSSGKFIPAGGTVSAALLGSGDKREQPL